MPPKMSKVRCTTDQKRRLCEYMSLHPLFANREFVGPLGVTRYEEQWMRLALELRQYGPDKSVTSWKTTWNDITRKSRKRNAAANRARKTTGNCVEIPELDEDDLLTLTAIGRETSEGVGPEESRIGDLNDLRETDHMDFLYGNGSGPSSTPITAEVTQSIPHASSDPAALFPNHSALSTHSTRPAFPTHTTHTSHHEQIAPTYNLAHPVQPTDFTRTSATLPFHPRYPAQPIHSTHPALSARPQYHISQYVHPHPTFNSTAQPSEVRPIRNRATEPATATVNFQTLQLENNNILKEILNQIKKLNELQEKKNQLLQQQNEILANQKQTLNDTELIEDY